MRPQSLFILSYKMVLKMGHAVPSNYLAKNPYCSTDKWKPSSCCTWSRWPHNLQIASGTNIHRTVLSRQANMPCSCQMMRHRHTRTLGGFPQPVDWCLENHRRWTLRSAFAAQPRYPPEPPWQPTQLWNHGDQYPWLAGCRSLSWRRWAKVKWKICQPLI